MSETFLYQRPLNKHSELNIWFAFPGIYSFGMSSLGYMSIFKTFDMREDFFVERIFTDTKNTQIKIEDVDVMGFSFSFELDFLSTFKILEKYKIPLKTKDRDENSPLIFAGGPVLTANPEPFCEIFDFIIIGDAEDNDELLMEYIKENKNAPKNEILKGLSRFEGVYVPSLTEFDIKKHNVLAQGKTLEVNKKTACLSQGISTPVLSEKSFFSNTYVIEIARGCPQRCGFCLASYLNLPVRFVDYDKVIESIDFGLRYTNKIAFLGALISAHPRFEDICDYVYNRVAEGENIELSVSSLRVDSVSEKVIKTLVACGQKHATIAIEAGSDVLRKTINKNLTDVQILETVDVAYKNGLKGFKIYAMVGLPTETAADIDAMIELGREIRKTYKDFELTFSFATFVPKAQTPFQYCKREDTKSLEKKYAHLKKQFHKIGIKTRFSSVKWDYVQALLSRGDRRLADYIIEVYKTGANLGAFKTAYKKFEKAGLLPEMDSFALDSIDLNQNLPWDFIKFDYCKNALKNDYIRLLGQGGN